MTEPAFSTGHAFEEGEISTFEAAPIANGSKEALQAAQWWLSDRVTKYATEQKRQLARVFFTVEHGHALCEAFYR